MHLPKPLIYAVILIAGLAAGHPALAQIDPKGGAASKWPRHSLLRLDSLRAHRWTVSVNPLGLLEGPMATGVGVGYRVSPHIELWTESSLLTNGYFTSVGKLRGFRQILQTKWFPHPEKPLFLAVDLRYKSFSFNDTADFYSTTGQSSLHDQPYHEHHYFWAVGLQAGFRKPLTRDGRLQLEYTLGIGFKYKYIDWTGVGPGYKEQRHSIDLNVRDIMNGKGASIYLPGSIRIIWTFGKRIL